MEQVVFMKENTGIYTWQK